MGDDIRYLDLLSTFHYVLAVVLGLFGLLPIFHLIIGIAIVTGSFDEGPGEGPPDWFGLVFIAMALMMMISMWAMAIAVRIAGLRLKRRTSYNFCLVVAAIECTFMPFGTVLGVLTILVLMRPTVKALFGIQTPQPASS